jgi:adenosylcobinamide-GDP ribazoletransferase
MLEIMKESRVGTNGVLILVIGLVAKLVLIYSLDSPIEVLIVMPVVSRLMVVVMSRFSKYARENGMGGFFIGKTTTPQLIIAVIITLLVHIIRPELLIVSVIVTILALIYRYHVYTKIDGITGDVLGAIVEMSEVFFLLIYILMIGA